MPKIVDHEERRKNFANAAMRVASKLGMDALTVRSVAKEAGCSTGALAHYYKTKDDLLIAIQRAAGDKSTARIARCFEQYEGRALLEAVVLTVLPLDEERRGEWRLWLAYFARAAENVDVAKIQQNNYERWRSDLLRAYELGCEGEGQTRAQLERGTDAAMTLIQGLGVLGMFQPAGMDPVAQRRAVRDHFDRWLP
ncbi:MAG TPA: TetR family transcriptional regulator [Myxococcales bacterium]|nr:TetR family transcriptional regulator [Myxococcales bacterium]HIL80327.1 TetR family transcriptional regulator [Myxococcales bacterium]